MHRLGGSLRINAKSSRFGAEATKLRITSSVVVHRFRDIMGILRRQKSRDYHFFPNLTHPSNSSIFFKPLVAICWNVSHRFFAKISMRDYDIDFGKMIASSFMVIMYECIRSMVWSRVSRIVWWQKGCFLCVRVLRAFPYVCNMRRRGETTDSLCSCRMIPLISCGEGRKLMANA